MIVSAAIAACGLDVTGRADATLDGPGASSAGADGGGDPANGSDGGTPAADGDALATFIGAPKWVVSTAF